MTRGPGYRYIRRFDALLHPRPGQFGKAVKLLPVLAALVLALFRKHRRTGCQSRIGERAILHGWMMMISGLNETARGCCRPVKNWKRHGDCQKRALTKR
ncbi:hypothetical protein BDW02DRAFT_61815 [Decorospora gaudefroyi]|uniref:Uncharacterized protein n=1 Tax=Decorospora gaudefroyi TaxID=184978 RepID=A0A6A5K8G0_9PLEO|nr:hypothetical protein BDW02DRAFT_61815 [Decorospora gaudefroyi]